jgi:poly(3-hydroxybutyrate) depolymerase
MTGASGFESNPRRPVSLSIAIAIAIARSAGSIDFGHYVAEPSVEEGVVMKCCIVGLPLRSIALWTGLLLAWPAARPALATTVGVLPEWVCAHPDAIFVDGFQPSAAITRLPSNGSGGAMGSVSRSVPVAGYGTHTFYLRVPPNYSPNHPVPLVLALHGQAGSPANAPAAAQAARNAWSSVADANEFIVIAPVATGGSGGWIAPPPNPTDYSIFAAAIADTESAYNIDRSRRIGWGFSAGGHVMHDIMFNDFGAPVSIDTFAAYGVSAGVLEAFACPNPSACDALVATASRHIPIDIHVGNSDPLLPYANSDHEIFVAQGWADGSTLWKTVFSGGHTYSTTHLEEIWAHLCPFQALP